MHDVRDAWRALRSTPIVSAAALVSLALSIGANTAIFSILNGLLIKPLPVRDPARLVLLAGEGVADGVGDSYPIWKEIRDRRLFDRPFAWSSDRVGLTPTGEAAFADAIWATGGFFDVLGVSAVAGRTFNEADDRPGGGPDGPVAVISEALWRTRFGGARDVVGRTLTIERVPYTIVGVAPREFFGLAVGRTFDVILPLETEPLLGRAPPRLTAWWGWLQIQARLGPGQTVEGLTAAVRAAQPSIRAATMPALRRAEDREKHLRTPWIVQAAPTGSSSLRTRYAPALFALLGIVALVLLVACANVAVLLLARMSARRYDIGVRLALGASPRRVARQLLVESLLLASSGAALGLALAQWGGRVLVAQLSNWAYTVSLDLSPDWRVLAVTVGVTGATVILFGIAPAWRATRVDPIEALRLQPRALAGDGRGTLGGRAIVAQVALSVVLLVAAGLFLRSFVALAYRDLGFDRRRLLIAVVDARRASVPPHDRAALYERMREAAAAVPGVESAALSMATPLGNAGVRFTRTIETSNGSAPVFTTPVSPGWFRTYGTRLIAGRDFTAADDRGNARVAIVNEAFVRKHLAGSNPLGQTLARTWPGDRQAMQIVGLVEDAAFTSVRDAIEPTMYTPLAQDVDVETFASMPTVSLTIRAARPARLTKSLADAMTRVDGELSIRFQTLTEYLDYYYSRERLLALVSGFFGVLALLLAAVGLYGVTAFAVSRRRTEIGIRLALGAAPGAVVRLVLGRLARLVIAGAAIGAIASLWAARFVAALLYGLPPRDPIAFIAAGATLAAVAVIAAAVPAWRASRLDPASVLRSL